MTESPRLSHQTLKVLRAFLSSPTAEAAGSDIWKETKIASGSLYPILARLEKAEWLTSRWEDVDPREAGRPRKRLYKLTGEGHQNAIEAFRELDLSQGELAWIT